MMLVDEESVVVPGVLLPRARGGALRLARLGTLRFRHGRGITAIVLSPDGRTVTSLGSDGSVVLHDAVTGKKLHSLAGEGMQARSESRTR